MHKNGLGVCSNADSALGGGGWGRGGAGGGGRSDLVFLTSSQWYLASGSQSLL